jgi:class 3 adenylate cyclase
VAGREFHYRWEWELESSPEALWPLVADTNRFNRDTGVPVVLEDREADAEGPLGRRLRLSVAGREIPYEERPFEWVEPERFGVTRRYLSGPVAELSTLLEVEPRQGGGSRLVYSVWARPRGQLGRLLIPAAIGRTARRRFAETFRRYDRLAARGAVAEVPVASSVRFSPAGRDRLARGRRELEAQGADPMLAERLVATVERADDLAVGRLRPYALADAWGADRREVLELCLLATRAGLLELRWELLCPLCRGAKETSGTLAGLERQVHCDACHIDFTADFERSVEITFRPSEAVRAVEANEYCVGGPRVTPHIVAQQILAPGERRALGLALEEGRYRLRAIGLPGSRGIAVNGTGPDRGTLTVAAEWGAGETLLATRPEVVLANETTVERLVVLERTAWSDRAATAADVTSLQAFRDLFSSEALRPGEEMSVGSLTVVFTDLRDSTRLYREIGDAPAYGSVVGHFDVLRDTVRSEGGAVVKTIGDAVMAVFRRPVPALSAVLAAQAELAAPPSGVRPLVLKAGIHAGPCIAVTLNDRLDYFGSTVNAAARLVSFSSGEDVVVSDAVRDDPEVAALIADDAYQVERLEASLKGFDDEAFVLYRVTRRG